MKTFTQWVNEARMHQDPFSSGLLKIHKQQHKLPFSTSYEGAHAIKISLGLDDEEVDALKQNKVIGSCYDPNYVCIDKKKVEHYLYKIKWWS